MLATLALVLAAQQASATPEPQPTTAPPPAASDSNGTEVVVTARRREERVQTVPIAVSVVTGAELERTGTYNVSKLTQVTPTVQFSSTNPRNSAATIRGLGAPFGLTNDGIEQGVGIYVDQVYYSRAASSTFDFLDVERLEVLRGPQGTLYGKNTTAGAVNITSRAPTFTPTGRAELTLGNLNFVQLKGSVSGPIVADKVAARLAFSSTDRRGTIFNVTSGKHVNAQDNFGIRGQVLWHATDNLEINLAGDYNRQNPECCAQIYVRYGPTQRAANRQYPVLAAAFGYAPPSTDAFDRLTDLDSDLRARQELGGVSLRADWDVGSGKITSVTAWRFWDWDPSNDRDFTGLPITTISANPSKQDQYTQELRYSSNSGGAIDYTIGLFGFHQTLHTSGLQVQGPAASRFLLNPTSAAALNPATLNNLRSENDIDFSNTSAALFGQLSWTPVAKLRIQPGLRLNYDRKKGSYVATVTNGTGTALTADQRGVLAPQTYEARFSAWNLSGDLTVAYDFATDVHGYATYARSFKSGGINLSGLPLDANNNPILSAGTVRPEKVNHVELGLKTQFDNRRGTFNLAGFWTEISDYQATVTNGQLGVLRGYLANAEKVRVRGVEADFSWRPTSNFSFYVNGAFTDHKYVKFVDAPCPLELSGGTTQSAANPTVSPPGTPGGVSPAACDISGQWLPGISKWSASYGGEYRAPLSVSGKGEWFVGVDASSRSKFSSNASRSIYTDIAGYTVVNTRLGVRGIDGWSAFGWVRNLFDTDYYEVLATQSGNTGLVVGQPADPRTYGVTIAKSF